MIKWTLKYSFYDSISGVSEAHINTNLGTFKGKAFLHEEDEDIESKFQGCKYAEMRAVSKYVSALIKNAQIKYDTLLSLTNDFQNINIYRENKYTKILKNKLDNAYNNLKNLKEYKQNLDKNIYKMMSGYREEVNNFRKEIKERQEPTN